MNINTDIQFENDKLIHFLNIEGLDPKHIHQIIDRANEYSQAKKKKFYDLEGKTVASLFFEPSTRTKTTFELASKKLSADFINIDIANSSTLKGESIIDMIKTLQAMSCDMFVVRHSIAGTPHFIAKEVGNKIAVLNAGDGAHAHPTQALLDMFTIKKYKGDFEGLKVAIVGDILHSRVARSLISCLNILHVTDVRVIGPRVLMPQDLESMKIKYSENLEDGIDNCDVVIMLRLQKERMHEALISEVDYYNTYGLTNKKLKSSKKDVIVMHPGPINRGIEIDSEVADGEHSVILDQVSSGISVRMAIMSIIIDNRKNEK